MMRPPIQPRRTPTRGGFTLVELMIAMAIIVLLIGIALPVFRVINGSRSQEGASNQIASMLAQARNDAIGLQMPTGVAFYANTAGQPMMAEVQQVQFSNWSGSIGYSQGSYVTSGGGYYVSTGEVLPPNSTSVSNSDPSTDTGHWQLVTGTVYSNSPGFYYLFDQIANTEAQRLPTGVGTMVLNDPGASSAGVANVQDRYLHVGLMLFDANGRLTTTPFWMSQFGLIGTSAGFRAKSKDVLQASGTLISQSAQNNLTPLPALPTVPVPSKPSTLFSSIGLVTFDGDSYANQGPPGGDTIIDGSTYGTTSTAGSKAAIEAWLDTNGTPVLIDRYNGTLLRSE